MELVKKELGQEAAFTVEVVAGNIVVKAELGTSGVSAALSGTINGDYFLDKLAEKIPGQIDDVVLGLLKAALKTV